MEQLARSPAVIDRRYSCIASIFVQSRAAGCLKETNKKSQSNQAECDRQQAHDERSVNSSGYRCAYGCSHHHTHRQIHCLGQAMVEFAHGHMRHGCSERHESEDEMGCSCGVMWRYM